MTVNDGTVKNKLSFASICDAGCGDDVDSGAGSMTSHRPVARLGFVVHIFVLFLTCRKCSAVLWSPDEELILVAKKLLW